jgi:ankyrin repeat protein
VNARNVKGNTPLHEAAQDGNPAILNALIRGGADLAAVNADGATDARAVFSCSAEGRANCLGF